MSNEPMNTEEETNEPVEGQVQQDPLHTLTQEIEVAGSKVIQTLRDAVKQGNVRRVIVRTTDDRVLLDTPLNVGLGVSGVMALLGGLPLMVVGAGIAALARVKVQIVREVRDGDVVGSDGNRVHVDAEAEDDDATES